jgi:endonuclease/exonuclease/phosphatase family metal-dependent hydrolase
MLDARSSFSALALLIVCACQPAVESEAPPPALGSAGSSAGSSGSGGSPAATAGASGGAGLAGAGTGGNLGGAGSAGNGGSSGSGGAPSSMDPEPAATAVTILTFNVRTQDADSVDAPLGNDWAKRLPQALALIADHAPDVVGLQEATEAQVSAISAGFSVLSAPGVSVLYDAERLEATEGAVVDVGNYGNMDPWGTRWCNWQRFKVKATGAEFVFFDTHLSTAGDNVPQSEFVFDLAATWAAQGFATIVVGDFNYDGAAMFGSKGFDDAVADHDGTFHAFAGGRSGPRLDFIATQAATTSTSGVDTRSDAAQSPTVYPSDHYPVWAVLEL